MIAVVRLLNFFKMRCGRHKSMDFMARSSDETRKQRSQTTGYGNLLGLLLLTHTRRRFAQE